MNRTHIPWAMSAARAAMGPLLALGATCNWNGLTLAGIVLTALLSDIFDGVLARRWHCDTAAIRLFDTLADTFFYLWTAWALWLASPAIWRQNAALLAVVVAMEILHAAFDLAKFGRPASYHSYLAKTWGLVLASGVITAFALHRGNALLTLALWIGLACKLEGIAMSLILPTWHRDIKTLAAAWRIRRQQTVSQVKRLGWGTASALVLTLAASRSFAAVEGNEVAYMGGTSSVPSGTVGTLDLSSPTTFIFLGRTPGVQVTIPYAQVACFAYETELTHHLGVLPAIAVGIVRTRKHRHFVTIEYTDESRKQQMAVFEVTKDLPRVIVPLLSEKVQQRCRVITGAK
jgi:phosphatidylglycerophosphate synthase